MFVKSEKEMPKIDMSASGAIGAYKQVAVGPEQGWDSHVMRIMTVEQGGTTPQHAHDWPHINYVISGTGVLTIGEQKFDIEKGICAYVPANAQHSFVNTGDATLEFICIVAKEGDR